MTIQNLYKTTQKTTSTSKGREQTEQTQRPSLIKKLYQHLCKKKFSFMKGLQNTYLVIMMKSFLLLDLVRLESMLKNGFAQIKQ